MNHNRSITVQRLLRAVLSVDDENRLVNSSPRTKLIRIRLTILADAFKLVPNPVDGFQVDRTIDAALQLIRKPLQLGPVARLQEICHGTAVPVGVQRPEYGLRPLFLVNPRWPSRRQALDRGVNPKEPSLVVEPRLDPSHVDDGADTYGDQCRQEDLEPQG